MFRRALPSRCEIIQTRRMTFLEKARLSSRRPSRVFKTKQQPLHAAEVETAMTAYTHQTTPTRYVEADGTRFAYRRFGNAGGVPLVSNMHFAARSTRCRTSWRVRSCSSWSI